MSTFTIIFHLQVGMDETLEARDFKQQAAIPFLPRKGDMVAVHHEGDFHEVHQVFWSPRGGFEVYFKDEFNFTLVGIKQLRKAGWKEDV